MANSLHERLTDIVHGIGDQAENIENILDGEFWLDAAERAKVRNIAARIAALIDEYDRLDPLPRDEETPAT